MCSYLDILRNTHSTLILSLASSHPEQRASTFLNFWTLVLFQEVFEIYFFLSVLYFLFFFFYRDFMFLSSGRLWQLEQFTSIVATPRVSPIVLWTSALFREGMDSIPCSPNFHRNSIPQFSQVLILPLFNRDSITLPSHSPQLFARRNCSPSISRLRGASRDYFRFRAETRLSF